MTQRNIVNIITFIRSVEHRASFSIVEPIEEQIKLIDRYGFKATFLLQYDALLTPEYINLMKALDPNRYEIGLWYEIPRPLCEACGLPWTSELLWDPRCFCDFPVGYTKEQREMLIDEAFRKFKEVFGYYPRSMGSWFYDTHTIRHIEANYGLDALCNCKEQYGTDGYTLWGGYYGQGYYPAKKNVFLPAQNKENQINIPLFRMLGSDHVYQYDFGMTVSEGARRVQEVITLEPAYTAKGGGGNPKWVDWYLKENYNGECLSFSYAQAGQENSFGWAKIKDGLNDQFAKFKALSDAGNLTIETLGETGRWYKESYPLTPASTITAHSAYDDPNKKSAWYCSKRYRINLYSDENGLRIRDLQLFDEQYADPYEETVCTGNDAAYYALPVIDGNLYSGNGIYAGVYPLVNGEKMFAGEMHFTKIDDDTAEISFTNGENTVNFLLTETSVKVKCNAAFELKIAIGKTEMLPQLTKNDGKHIDFLSRGKDYSLCLEKGEFTGNGILPTDGEVLLTFA